MTIDEFAAKLPGAIKRGRRYIAPCPLHPEDGAVLKVRSEFGMTELECKRGCSDMDIARAIGLDASDLMDDDDDTFTGGHPPGYYDDDDDDDEDEVEEVVEKPYEPPAMNTAYGKVRLNAFDTMPARKWIRTSAERPVPRKLFGPFWMEGEISILFADTGKGKSVLAVQIAESLASERPIAPFTLDIPGQKVLYFDFELSDKMFEARYSVPPADPDGPTTDHYPFHSNFLRAQLNGDPDYPAYYDTWSEYLYHSLDETFRETEARLVIIDNITFFGTKSKEQSGGALHTMRVLHQFRHEYGLSILVIAHTPKRLFRGGLTVNDLQGSKMLSNFADNVFAIGESCLGPDIRYLKHIKPRNSPLIHGASNVCVYRIEKKSNFLGFEFMGYGHEREHLERLSADSDVDERLLKKKVKEMAALGISIRQIAKELGISRTVVTRLLRSLD